MGKTLKAKLLERKLKTNEEKKKSVKTNGKYFSIVLKIYILIYA